MTDTIKQNIYTVDYEVTTANGNKVVHRMICKNPEEIEATCKRCELLGIKVVMVNHF